MKTYQDLLEVGEGERERMEFCLAAIASHKSDKATVKAEIAQRYFDGENVTISTVDKFITDAYGKKVPDIWSPNHKIKCHLYRYFVIQESLYLLGNGIAFNDKTTLDKLGPDFEKLTLDAVQDCLNAGRSFGFWNLDHIEIFTLSEFVPLYDEETGRIMAGIRFWQLEDDKPLRVTLFEPDGLTEYIKRKSEDMEVMKDKTPYVRIVTMSSTGTEIAPGKPYPGLPIFEMKNVGGRSELEGNREAIDAYDLMASKIVNNIDNGEFIYWIIKNAPYMAEDQRELQLFIQRIRTSGVASTGQDQEIEAHQVEIPFEATEAGLNFMRRQLFSDFMAFDPTDLRSGAATATEIRAAYEPLNSKVDLLEYQVTSFISEILRFLGIDDIPRYTRSQNINKQEEVQTVLLAAEYLDEEYTTRKVCEILGDADAADEILKRKDVEDMERFAGATPEQEPETEGVTGA